MSKDNVEVVRQRLAVADRPRRRWEQHLVRFPRLIALGAKPIWWLYLRLPSGSRLRRAIVRRYVQQGFEALNRRDLDATFILYHRDVESIFPAQMVSLGLDPVYRGRQARIDVQAQWNAEWGDWQFEGDELIEFGDGRVLVTGFVHGSGLSSGVVVANEIAFLFRLSGGQVIREQFFLGHREALKAAGLQE